MLFNVLPDPFHLFTNIFKIPEFNPLCYKKEPYVKISIDLLLLYIYNRFFFSFGGGLRKELLYERSRTDGLFQICTKKL